MKDAPAPTRIVVLGSINMDLVGVATRFPSAGETVVGESFHTSPGGKGANQAVAAARLGADVKMVGRVGADTFGPPLLANLESHGIDVEAVARDPGNATGVAMILLDSRGENRIVVVGGANAACADEQLAETEKALQGTHALLLQLEIPAEVSLAAARIAKELGVRVIWDPAPAGKFPAEAYAATDILTPNESEATSLTGIEVTDERSATAAAEVLLSRGLSVAVVTLGQQGAVYASKEGNGFMAPFQVNAVDTVAAGDAFGAGLAVALSEGMSLGAALRFGSAAGALAVTRSGAQEAMPTRHDVDALLNHP